MNAIRCPNCQATNQTSALQCVNCQLPFSNLPMTAYVSVPVEQTYQAQALGMVPPPAVPQDNDTGRKAFLWYRVYCGVMVALYFLVAGLGVVMAVMQPETREYRAEEMLIMGIVYAVIGVIFAVVFLVALFLPRKSYNWIVGIVMIALGMTSCCFLPFLIPLLIFWLKPETKAYFGRS
jgi:MFS family permease